MELTAQNVAEMKAKNNALMTLVALNHLAYMSLFDLRFGNPANWRVLYHNTLDAYLNMPGTPSEDVRGFAEDAWAHAQALFFAKLAPAAADAKPVVVNLVVADDADQRMIGELIGRKIAELAPDRDFVINVDLSSDKGEHVIGVVPPKGKECSEPA